MLKRRKVISIESKILCSACCRSCSAVRPAVGRGLSRRGECPSPRSDGPSPRSDGNAPRRHGHVVPHAHQRHDPQQLPLVATRSVQPDQQRVRIARLVVQRREDRVDRVLLGRAEQARLDFERDGRAPRCESGNDCRGWLMGDSSQNVRLRRRFRETIREGLGPNMRRARLPTGLARSTVDCRAGGISSHPGATGPRNPRA